MNYLFDWEDHRWTDGGFSLCSLFAAWTASSPTLRQKKYLDTIQALRPIRSRQVAALAIATAKTME